MWLHPAGVIEPGCGCAGEAGFAPTVSPGGGVFLPVGACALMSLKLGVAPVGSLAVVAAKLD